MSGTEQVMVSANIICKTQDDVLRAVEALARAAAGLAFEGMYASVSLSQIEDDDP